MKRVGLFLATFLFSFGLIAAINVNNAMAAFFHPWVQQSDVVSNANGNAATWNYTYTLYNKSYEDPTIGLSGAMPVIVDWELPYFTDAGITNIVSPTGWNYAIETIGTANPTTGWDGIAAWQSPTDPLYQGATSPFTSVAQVLHWYNIIWATTSSLDVNAIYPVVIPPEGQTSLSGFGFTAAYGSTGAPYQASWAGLPHWTGDPPFPLQQLGGVPASPDTTNQTIPEPATLLLLGFGLLGIAGVSRKKN